MSTQEHPTANMVFHAPYPLNRAATSASGIRPVRMRDAFAELGYTVWEVTGNSRERRAAIRRVRAALRDGVRFDFCYSESSTMPTAMTEAHHLPLHPVMDFAFLADLRRHGVRVGLFYRDIYWRFGEYGRGMHPAQRAAALAMYRYDLRAYRAATDIVYLPSEQMAEHVDPARRLTMRPLPPGHGVTAPTRVPAAPLRLLYVGGLNDHYRLHALVDALRNRPEVQLTICTREGEWQAEQASYAPLPPNVTVVHRSGDELAALYDEASIAVMFTEPMEYRTFAAPLKLVEYIGWGKPVLASSGTLAGEFVTEHGCGWTIPYDADSAAALLATLAAHPEQVDAAADASLATAPALTWRARAQQVVGDVSAAHASPAAAAGEGAGDDQGRHRPRRVLMVGAARSIHTARWANALAAEGLDVHLATIHPVGEQHYDPRVTIHALPRARGAGYVLAAPALRRLVVELRPDLVNTHYATGYGTLSTLALTGSPVPNLLSVWGADVYDVPLKSPAHEQVVRRNLAAATAIASTSRAMAEQTRRWCADRPILLTPFGIDLDAFPVRESAGRASADDVVASDVVVGTVKTLHPKYGVDTLIEAFALAHATRPGLRLEIYGEGPQRAELEALAERLGVAGSVCFHGAIPHDQVPAAMRSLDIYVALSRLDSESFGVAILEASASGVPVVVSDASGPAEVTDDGVTGFVVPRDDAAAAAEAIGRLADDSTLRQQMGTAGRHHVEQHYTWQASVDSMLDAYRRTLALQKGGRRG